MSNLGNFVPEERQPVFNLPPVIVACVAVLAGIHIVRVMLLTPDADFDLILGFAFIPLRVMEPAALGAALPGGSAAAAWSFLTYAFFHADWMHLLFNSLWLAAFGSPLAWRFGTVRFLAFSATGAIAGALVYLAFNSGEWTPMIGASAAVSAYMAGATRFVFSAGGPLGGFGGPAAYRRPVPPLGVALTDRRVITFLGIWFGLNLLFGLWVGETAFASGAIAWEAHIGGFLAGLLLFRFFDPIKRA